MLDLIVFIKCDGVNVRLDNVSETIYSFHQKNQDVNYKFYIVADGLTKEIECLFRDVIGPEKLLALNSPSGSWAVDFNLFLDKHSEDSEWLLISHDDVKFLTDDYFRKMVSSISPYYGNEVGWLTSTSEHYYKNLGKMVTDTFRPGFHKDGDKWPAMFQLHDNDPDNIDYPSGPVKIHGPMSAVMLITMESMKKVGACEDWTPYTMLVDEDWSLEALKNNLPNIWVPDVFHLHPNRIGKRKAFNRWEKEAHSGFIEKWGFLVGGDDPNQEQGCSIGLEGLREKWGHTLIPWSSYRNSYEWEYLE